jgi:hypothetical protein
MNRSNRSFGDLRDIPPLIGRNKALFALHAAHKRGHICLT